MSATKTIKRLNKLQEIETAYECADFIQGAHTRATDRGWVSPEYTQTEKLLDVIHGQIQMGYGMEASENLSKPAEKRIMENVRNTLFYRLRTDADFQNVMIRQTAIREKK
jgi:hypothetical protein